LIIKSLTCECTTYMYIRNVHQSMWLFANWHQEKEIARAREGETGREEKSEREKGREKEERGRVRDTETQRKRERERLGAWVGGKRERARMRARMRTRQSESLRETRKEGVRENQREREREGWREGPTDREARTDRERVSLHIYICKKVSNAH